MSKDKELGIGQGIFVTVMILCFCGDYMVYVLYPC